MKISLLSAFFISLAISLLLSEGLHATIQICDIPYLPGPKPVFTAEDFYRPDAIFGTAQNKLIRKVDEREVPIIPYIGTFSAHKVAVVRTYESEEFLTDVINTEFRPGVPQELIRRCAREGLWPTHSDGTFLGNSDRDRMDVQLGEQIKRHIMGRGYGVAGRVRDIMRELQTQSIKHWGELTDEGLEFAIKNYERRDWNDDFKVKLRKQAKDFAGGSTYIIVREKKSLLQRGRIIGTLRLYRAPFGRRAEKINSTDEKFVKDEIGVWGPAVKFITEAPSFFYNLPVNFNSMADEKRYDLEKRRATGGNLNYYDLPLENGLKIKLPREIPMQGPFPQVAGGTTTYVYWGAGEVIEPGTYAISKEVNSSVFLDILIHLLGFVADPNFSGAYNANNRQYYTYNDLYRLYTIFGFKKVGEPILMNGTKWHLLKASGGDLMATVERLLQIKQGLDPVLLNDIKDFIMRAGAIEMENSGGLRRSP